MRSADGRRLHADQAEGVSSVQDAGRVPGDTGSRVPEVQSYGGVVRESANQRYERHVAAIEAELRRSYAEAFTSPRRELRRVAESILAAAEVGF